MFLSISEVYQFAMTEIFELSRKPSRILSLVKCNSIAKVSPKITLCTTLQPTIHRHTDIVHLLSILHRIVQYLTDYLSKVLILSRAVSTTIMREILSSIALIFQNLTVEGYFLSIFDDVLYRLSVLSSQIQQRTSILSWTW